MEKAKVNLEKLAILLVVQLFNLIGLFGQPGKDQPMNIIYILSDDHRYDFMGFMGKVPALKTPGMDKMANEGLHLKNAFVTTALCSPSRASVLTGQYAHTHTVVDNDAPLPENLIFFPHYLQKLGYKTGFMGKWHMGNTGDQPQPGFDKWISFKGQGRYTGNLLNIDGKQVQTSKEDYITDVLTDKAIDWMNTVKSSPFCLYLSHKGVHAEFEPAKRHKDMYRNLPVQCPPSMYLTVTDSSKTFGVYNAPQSKVNYRDIPKWVREQRYSWHGVDYMYHGQITFDEFYHLYLETLQAVDESVARVLDWVEKSGLKENTLVVYMGDNGFLFGEHGLIDKRNAYEESMRVPLLMWAPGMIKPNSVAEQMVLGIDLAPTFLEIAGMKAKPVQMQGTSMLPLLNGEKTVWRDKVFYEYYWESAFPQTPTIFSVRGSRYKYIFNYGTWDINELYDLKEDPNEMNNLIRDTAFAKVGLELREQLFKWLDETNGLNIPLKQQRGRRGDNLYKGTY